MHLNTCVMYSRVAQDDRSLTDSELLSSPNIGMETPDRRNESDSFGSRRKLTWISREDGSCWRANSPVERQSIQADGSVTTIPNCPPVSAYKRCESPTRKAPESVRRKRNPGSMDFDIDEASCDFLLTGRGDCNPEPIKGGSGEIEMDIEMDISEEQTVIPGGAPNGEKTSAQQAIHSEDSPSSTTESGESLMVVSYLAQETDRIIKARNLLNFRSNSHAPQRTISGQQSPSRAGAEQRSSSPSTGRSSSRKVEESRDHTKSSYKFEKQYRTEPESFSRTQSDKHYRVESDFSSNRSKSDKHLLYGPREPDVPAFNRARGHTTRKSGEFPKSGPSTATEQQSMAPSKNADGPRPDPRTITESMKKFLEGRRTGSDMGTQILLSTRPGNNQSSSRAPEPLVNRAEPRQDAKNLPSRSDNKGTRRFDELHSQRGAPQGPEDLKESTSNMGSPIVFSTRPNIYPTLRTPEHLANRPGIAKEGQNPPQKPNNRDTRRLEHFNSPPVTMMSPLHHSTEAMSRHYHFNSRPVTLHSPLHDHGPDYVGQSALPSSLERHVDSGQGNVQLGAQVRPFGNRSPHWEKFLASGEGASNEGIRNLAQWARDQTVTVPPGEEKSKTHVSNEVSNSVERYISEAQRRKALSNSQASAPGHSGQEMEDLWKTPSSRQSYHPQLSPHRSVANSPFNASVRDHSQNPFNFRRVSLSGPQPATTDYNSLRGSPLVSHLRNSFPHSRPPTDQGQILSNVDKSRLDAEHTKVMVPCVDKPLTNVGTQMEKDPLKEMHTSGLSNSRSFEKEISSHKPLSQSTTVDTNEQTASKPSTSSPPKKPRSASPAAHLQRWVANQFKLGLKSKSSSSKDGESQEPKAKPTVQEEQLRSRKKSPWRSRPAEIFHVMTRHKAGAPKPQTSMDRVPQTGRGSDRWTDGHGHVPKTTQIDGGSSAAATPPKSKRFSSASPSRFRGFQKLFSGDHSHVAPVPISLSTVEVKCVGQPPIPDTSPVNDVTGFIDRMEALIVKND